jgi:catechol 2,3-dioxygenase-like lactoylglutathione lyase family enzyme
MLHVTSVTMSSADPTKLAAFYREALDCEVIFESPDAVYLSGTGDVRIGFDRVQGYEAPPWTSGSPPRIRIDVATDDLSAAEARLLALGATRPGHDADTEDWIFLADPEGHPFCVTMVF